MSEGLSKIILLVPVFLISLSVHEYAHGWVANQRGDSTAKRLGRLTLNPLAHADFFGTLLLPMLGIYYNFPIFGWAKPVPVDGRNLKNGLRDMALVAIAGPISNLLLALLFAIFLGLTLQIPNAMALKNHAITFGVVGIQINAMLAIFNLLPFPPLDGFRVVQGIVSSRMAFSLFKLERVGTFGLLILFFLGGLKYLSEPIQYVTQLFVRLAADGSYAVFGGY